MKSRALLLAAFVPFAPAAAEPLEMFNNRPFVAVVVNGQRTRALVDSAAEMTILDAEFARRIGLAAGGGAIAHGSGAAAMQARFAEHVLIRAAGLGTDQQVAILDLADVSRRLIGRPIDLILGRDFFDRGRLRIDPAAGTVEVFAGRPRGLRLPVGEHRGTPTVPAAVEGHAPVQAVLDTGNGTEVLIGRAYAERLGLAAPGRIVARSAGGGLGGERVRDIVLLRTLTLAGRTFRDVRAAIDVGETASDINVGMSILSHFRITTDFAGHQVWLEPIE